MSEELNRFKEFVKWFEELVFGVEEKPERAKGYSEKHTKQWVDSVKKPKRARTKKGRYKADDKSTKDVNEAWVGGKAPKKKSRRKKK